MHSVNEILLWENEKWSLQYDTIQMSNEILKKNVYWGAKERQFTQVQKKWQIWKMIVRC